MAFITPQSEYNRIRRIVAEQFAEVDRGPVYLLLEPLIEKGTEIPLCILQLAHGRKDAVAQLVDRAREDYRDVIYWASNRGESAIDTPQKIEALQEMLEWLGEPRSPELEAEKQEMLSSNRNAPVSSRAKAWCRFW